MLNSGEKHDTVNKHLATSKKVKINGKEYMTQKIGKFREFRAARKPRNRKNYLAFKIRSW